MGVKQLETYLDYRNIENRGIYCKEVNIRDLVAQYKLENGDENVKIVVDGNCFQYELYNFKQCDWRMGGQLLKWKEVVRKFINSFQCIGVELIFFFDGSAVKEYEEKWKIKQKQTLKRNKEIFKQLDKVHNGISVHPNNNGTRIMPATIGSCGRFLLKHELNCKVRVSVGDCDRELAIFAKQEKCFGILAKDTDYLIMNGVKHYFSLKHLNIETMDTIWYDQEEFAKCHGLRVEQLPLFASVLGNDHVELGELKKFFSRICGETKVFNIDIGIKVPKVADFIKNNANKGYELKEVAEKVFGKNATRMLPILQKSLNSYETTRPNEDTTQENIILNVAKERHVNCENPRSLYPILLGDPYEFKVNLEDFSTGLPPIASVFLPLRQKIYGILLHDFRERTTSDEWCVLNQQVNNIPQQVEVIREYDTHPGIETLWLSNSAETVSERWKIFAWSISPDINIEKLKKLRKNYIIPAATLRYLLHENTVPLSEAEVNAFISQAVLLHHKHQVYDQLVRGSYEKLPTRRMVHVSTLLGRGLTTIQLLMAACGFNLLNMKAMTWLYFDGKLFKIQYAKAEKKPFPEYLLNQDEQLIEDFSAIKEIAYNQSFTNTRNRERESFTNEPTISNPSFVTPRLYDAVSSMGKRSRRENFPSRQNRNNRNRKQNRRNINRRNRNNFQPNQNYRYHPYD